MTGEERAGMTREEHAGMTGEVHAGMTKGASWGDDKMLLAVLMGQKKRLSKVRRPFKLLFYLNSQTI